MSYAPRGLDLFCCGARYRTLLGCPTGWGNNILLLRDPI